MDAKQESRSTDPIRLPEPSWRIAMNDVIPGDWVQTDTGLKGQVIHVVRLTAFVEITFDGGKETLPFLLSELSRVNPPQERSEN
jgi:hypothetical protein